MPCFYTGDVISKGVCRLISIIAGESHRLYFEHKHPGVSRFCMKADSAEFTMKGYVSLIRGRTIKRRVV